jgi:hypothetical protein
MPDNRAGTNKKPDQYCTGQVRIVKPKINQSNYYPLIPPLLAGTLS